MEVRNPPPRCSYTTFSLQINAAASIWHKWLLQKSMHEMAGLSKQWSPSGIGLPPFFAGYSIPQEQN
jgi:hypothetical protein